eukprot:4389023-Alexandrium_andersonii.AAC.1
MTLITRGSSVTTEPKPPADVYANYLEKHTGLLRETRAPSAGTPFCPTLTSAPTHSISRSLTPPYDGSSRAKPAGRMVFPLRPVA